MKKRLRNKKHLGEFQQMGFTVRLHFHSDVTVADWKRIADEFIFRVIEAYGLQFGGGGATCRTWSGFVCRDHRYQSTSDADRRAVESWLRANPEIKSYEISEFIDAHSQSNQN